MKRKSVPKVEVVNPKKRVSVSMTEWLVEYVKEEAAKEKRSFSQMVDRLVYEANRFRTGMVKQNVKAKK